MTITADPTPQTELFSAEQAQLVMPKLSDEQLATLLPFGATEPTAVGQVLYAAGDAGRDLMVVLEGEVEASDTHEGRRRPIVVFRPRDFIAELGLLTGQRAFTTCVVTQAGCILRIPRRAVEAVIEADGALGELLVQTMFRRRELLLMLGAGVQIVGSRYSPDTQRLREFAARNRLAYAWADLDTDPGAPPLRSLGFTPRETPVVLLGGAGVLVNPSNAELATAAGTPRSLTQAPCSTCSLSGRGRPDSPLPSTEPPRASRPRWSTLWPPAARRPPRRHLASGRTSLPCCSG